MAAVRPATFRDGGIQPVLTGDTIDPTFLPESMATPANDAWGQASTVTPGATATLASVIAPAGYVVMGLIGTGTGEGYFSVRVGSLVVASGRIRSAAPTLDIALPNGIAVAAGAQVVLAVTNEADATAAYEGTLLGA